MTNAQQRRLYWPEWNASAKILAANGFSKSEIDEQRLDIHQQVTNTRCSSKTLTNRQLDAVIDKFRAIRGVESDKAQEQPEVRLRYKIRALQKRMKLSDAYIRTTSENICGVAIDLAMESQLIKVLVALEIHEKRSRQRVEKEG